MADLKSLIAEKFGTTTDKVTDAQVAAFQGVYDELKAAELPNVDEGAAQTKAVEDLRKQLEGETKAREEFQRQVAEWKDKPQVDPESDRQAMDRLSHVKSIPDFERFVRTPPQDDSEKAMLTVWDSLHTLSTLKCDRETGHRAPVKGLKYWQELEAIAPRFVKLLDTQTSGGSSEWAPTEYSSQLVDAIYDDVVVPGIFPRFTMTRSPLTRPFGMTSGTAYKAGEATTDTPPEYTATDTTVDDVTFTAVKLAMLVNVSEEMDEESIIPFMPQLQAHIRRTLGEGIEDAILEGQATAAIDSNVTSSASRYMLWDGIRYFLTQTTTTALKSFGTFDGDNAIGAVLEAMTQKYVQDAVWIFPAKKKYKVAVVQDNSTNKIPLYLRATELGDRVALGGATAAGDLLGNPVVFSSRMLTNLNASGVYDGTTTTKTWAAFVNRNAWMLGDRREVRLEVERKPAAGYSRMIGTWRGVFKRVQGDDVHTGGGYNW